MSVLFCLWADKEEEGGDVPEEDIVEPKENEITDESDKELIKGCEKITSEVEASINDVNVNNFDSETSGKSNDDKTEISSSSNREPDDKAVDEIPVKDCLRAPGMFFSLWKDQEEEWESEVSEDDSEEDERPKFFSFAESHDGDALSDVQGKDLFRSESEEKDNEIGNNEDSCEIREAHGDEDQNKDEIVVDNLDDACGHDEFETESDFSVDDLVIQKVETTSKVKVEHESPKVEDKLSQPKPVRKTFARKSTAPSRSSIASTCDSVDVPKICPSKAVATKSNKRKVEKADKTAPVSRNKRICSSKAVSKASTPHQGLKPARPRRMVESTYSRNVQVKIGDIRTEFGDEVKLEAEENDPVEMCNLITDTIEVEENIKQLKMEDNDNIDIPEEDAYEYTSLGDPLGDPLSIQLCSSVTDRPFLWPKLDPLFHTVTEFKLSREFAKLIRALEKPTAKIQPLVRPSLSQLEIKTDVKEEVRQETPPALAASSRPQRLRKRKMPHGVPSSELKSLLSPSYVHDPPAITLPSRRRSVRQEDKVEQEDRVEEETESSRKRKSSLPVVPPPAPGKPPKRRPKRVKPVAAKKVRPDVSVVGSVSVCGGGEYLVVCKTGNYECPLCSTRWSLNQTYGRHVVTRTCQVQQDRAALTSAPWILAEADHDEELAILNENISPRNNIFVFVNPATVRKDSYVSTSHVPSLKLLCRGAIPRACSAPPLRVKEGLEYYHALVWPDNNKEEVVFKYMSRLANITMVTSVGEYEKLCREPLKVALYLEKKISKSREKVGHRHSQTRKWVEKYTLYLTFPLHDIFLVVSQAGYRVLEFPLKEGRVGLLCLVCPTMSCKGCLSKQSTKLPTWQPGKKPPLKVAIRTLPKVRKEKPLKPVVTNPSASAVPAPTSAPQKPPPPPEPKLPPLQLHICSPCKTVFNSRLALSSHRGLCRGAKGE